jgi:hypothetical protein
MIDDEGMVQLNNKTASLCAVFKRVFSRGKTHLEYRCSFMCYLSCTKCVYWGYFELLEAN